MGEASNEDLTAEQVRALREDIDQTREQIGDTLEAIGEKLSPANMVQEAAQTVRDAASRTVENVMTTASERVSDLAEQGRDTVEAVRRRVGDNAVPAAVAAAFLGWVAYKALRRNGSSVRPYNARWRDMPEPGSDDREWTRGSYDRADDRDWTRHATDSIRTRVNSTARQAADGVSRVFRQNPLAVAVAAAAVGVAVGLSVPETETENRVLGETRDVVLERAKEAIAHPMER